MSTSIVTNGTRSLAASLLFGVTPISSQVVLPLPCAEGETTVIGSTAENHGLAATVQPNGQTPRVEQTREPAGRLLSFCTEDDPDEGGQACSSAHQSVS